jgi:hypothetical protein
VVHTGDEFRAAAHDLREVAEPFTDAALVLLLWAIFLFERFDQHWDLLA